MLVNANVSLDQPTDGDDTDRGSTPLHLAAERGEFDAR